MQVNTQKIIEYTDIVPGLVDNLLENYPYKGTVMDLLYPNLVFN